MHSVLCLCFPYCQGLVQAILRRRSQEHGAIPQEDASSLPVRPHYSEDIAALRSCRAVSSILSQDHVRRALEQSIVASSGVRTSVRHSPRSISNPPPPPNSPSVTGMQAAEVQQRVPVERTDPVEVDQLGLMRTGVEV